MSWTFLVGLVVVLGSSLLAALSRRADVLRMRGAVRDRDRAARLGDAEARLQHPVVDLSRCLGCATCVAVCPEDGVLEVVHGQATVVNGARCVGVSACERECPVGAITVTIANLDEREDVPALSGELEAIGSPGLFLAGEVTAHALIKTAVEHGTAVAREVARRVREAPGADPDVLDLCIVGAGPAGLACALESKRLGLDFLGVDQETAIGGAVAKYPRRKLVLTEPVELPLHGRLAERAYSKEELIATWHAISAEHELPILGGRVLEGVEREPDGTFVVRTDRGEHRARHVCLALGRRGVPRRLGVPGEELPKVAYSLLDAGSYRNRRVLVVGGGDSAVEAAVALAEQPGNEVTLSYRKEGFYRIRRRSEERLDAARTRGGVSVLFGSEVSAIGPGVVDLTVRGGSGPRSLSLPNDEVFVMAGGVPPFELLGRSGVSFDPRLRPAATPIHERGTGVARALAIAFVLALATLAFAVWHADYYLLPAEARPAHPKHLLLRPGRNVGLGLGIAASGLILANLAYLLRRSPRVRWSWGSLQAWMTSHVATGVLAFLGVLLHAAMAPRDTVGGHAFWSLAALLATGAVGRYFYAWVPRAANGRELEIAEVKERLDAVAGEWAGGSRRFRERARDEVAKLVDARQWRGSFAGRVLALFGVERDLRRSLARLSRDARRAGVDDHELRETVDTARRAHRAALMAAHFEDLRAIAGSWRFFHRWVALLMMLLVLVHVVFALSYGASWSTGGAR